LPNDDLFGTETCSSVEWRSLQTAVSVISSYSQQDATFLDLFISKDALHVSGGSSAHHQEHTAVQTALGIVIHGSS